MKEPITETAFCSYGSQELTKDPLHLKYEGWNFNSGNYLFTTDTK